MSHEWAKQQAIEADLSRADWLLLFHYCHGRNVVELGSGGSTAMLARACKRLVSYETDKDWHRAVGRRLQQRGVPHVDLRLDRTGVDPEAPKAEVYVIDCASAHQLRSRWLKHIHEHRLARTVLIHDSRRASPTNDLGWLWRWPETSWLDEVHFHPNDSNYIVLHYRAAPVRYENWQREPNRRQLSIGR